MNTYAETFTNSCQLSVCLCTQDIVSCTCKLLQSLTQYNEQQDRCRLTLTLTCIGAWGSCLAAAEWTHETIYEQAESSAQRAGMAASSIV